MTAESGTTPDARLCKRGHDCEIRGGERSTIFLQLTLILCASSALEASALREEARNRENARRQRFESIEILKSEPLSVPPNNRFQIRQTAASSERVYGGVVDVEAKIIPPWAAGNGYVYPKN